MDGILIAPCADLLRTHSHPVVVNVGCGLDTRFQRIGSQKAVFYDLDLPEVIALRRELIPEQPDNVYIEASLLETDWMDDLRRKHPDAEFIFIVEGGTDVLLREASKSLPASRGKPFRGR